MQVNEVYKNIYLVNNIYRKAGEEDKGFQIISLKESIPIFLIFSDKVMSESSISFARVLFLFSSLSYSCKTPVYSASFLFS